MTRSGHRGEVPQSASPGGHGSRLEPDMAEWVVEPGTAAPGAGKELEGKEPLAPGIKGDVPAPRIKPDSTVEASSGVSAFSMGRHFMYACEKPHIPAGAHVVLLSGPDQPWHEGPEAFDRAFAQMTEYGLTSVRIDLLWMAVEPERGRLDEAHLAVLD